MQSLCVYIKETKSAGFCGIGFETHIKHGCLLHHRKYQYRCLRLINCFPFFFFYILVSEAIFVYNVNSTIMDSALLGCSVPVKTNLKNLRFYWQDERKAVLYSFNKGKTMFTHVKDPYLNRTAAFTQEMTKGNISVLVKNLTLGDNGRIFEAYAAVFNGSETVMQTSKVCHANLYVTGKRGSWLCWCLCFMKKWVYQRNFWKRLFWVNTQSSH